MSQNSSVPTWFWVVAVLALIWNLLGVFAYISQVTMSEAAMSALPAQEQALYAAIPIWATSAFAIAVFAGAAGSVLLLLRKNIAMVVFVVSLFGVLVQQVYNFFISDWIKVLGANSLLFPAIVFVIACSLVWFSRMAKGKGWLT